MIIPEVNNLIKILEDVLAKEPELKWRVPIEVKDFKTELENMQLFLIDVDQGEMQEQSFEGVEMKWVADIRDKAYEAEDIIDEFTHHMNKHQYHITCLSMFLHLLVDAPKTFWVKHQTAHKLQKIKKEITYIAKRHIRYESSARSYDADSARRTRTRYLERQQAVKDLRDRSYFTKEKFTIGFLKETDSLNQLLLLDSEPYRTVISVFGMGGSGKTTLVSNIYKTQRGGFDLSAWVTISQTYSIIELLRSLIRRLYEVEKKKAPTDLDNKVYLELVEMVKDCLKGKRYLLVLDDVWDTNVWEKMKGALPEDEVGSRILVTTRDERYAPPSSDVKSYKLHIGKLKGSESWELFSMNAFPDFPFKTCPPELEMLARKLVDKCKGLPLALVDMGIYMSSRREEHEWIDVSDNLFKSPFLNDMLRPSFSGLPYSLKCCFLYCCLFPEDYPIKRKRLIRQWIAEGFVEGDDEITCEKMAELYFAELVFRNMLLVETRNEGGEPKVIKMHNVMRDFALQIAKNNKFCGVCDWREAINDFEAYRWSIHCSNVKELKVPGSDMTRVRSLSVFGNPTSFSREHLLKFKMMRLLDLESNVNTKELADEVGNFFNLRYLRLSESAVQELPSSIGRLRNLQTLDISGSEQVSALPHEVGNLFNLRYLNLRGTAIRNLPSSIGRLLNLQTLNISWTSIIELPEGVSKLRKLRHLTMKTLGFRNGIPIAFDISKLNKLQVLIGVRIDKGETLRQLGTLTKLTRLDISVHRDGGHFEERRKNWEALGQLKLLQRFNLKSDVWGDTHIKNLNILPQLEKLEKLIILPPDLKKIHLGVSVRFESGWFAPLHNIQHMSLRGCTVSGHQLPEIAQLENLVRFELSYWRSDDHEKVLRFCGGFAKLKQLSLIGLSRLEKVIFEMGAMPHMESLSIRDCDYLLQLPKGIEYLTNLQKLELEVPERLKEGIKNWEFQSKVQHIPTIDIK